MAVNTAAVNQIIPIDKRRMGTTTTFIPDRLYFMRQCLYSTFAAMYVFIKHLDQRQKNLFIKRFI